MLKRIFITLLALIIFTACSENPDTPLAGGEAGGLDDREPDGGEAIMAAEEFIIPETAPILKVGYGEQNVQAIQLGTSWGYEDENGIGSGYEADSPHALQLNLSAYDAATILVGDKGGEIIFNFGSNYIPEAVTVQRWPVEYADGNQDISDVFSKSEQINATVNEFAIENDGSDYIYEVYARWSQDAPYWPQGWKAGGSSHFAFRVKTNVNSASIPDTCPECEGPISTIFNGPCCANDDGVFAFIVGCVNNHCIVYPCPNCGKGGTNTVNYDPPVVTTVAATPPAVTITTTTDPQPVPMPVEPEPLKPLSAAAEKKLKENYLAYKYDIWMGMVASADDLTIVRYYGTYNGNEVVIIYPHDWGHTDDFITLTIAGYGLGIESGSFELMLHKDNSFIGVQEAYNQGFLSDADIGAIHYHMNNR